MHSQTFYRNYLKFSYSKKLNRVIMLLISLMNGVYI